MQRASVDYGMQSRKWRWWNDRTCKTSNNRPGLELEYKRAGLQLQETPGLSVDIQTVMQNTYSMMKLRGDINI